jgi:hypothetical protein
MARNTHADKTIMLLILCIISVNFALFSQNTSTSILKESYIQQNQNHYFTVLSQQNFAASAFLNYSLLFLSVKNQYILKEMTDEKLSFHYQHQKNVWGSQLSHFGYSKYGTLNLSVGYARAFSKHFAFGMQFYYLWNHAFQYASLHSITFDLSFQVRIRDKEGFGAVVYNPVALKYGILEGEMIPMRFEVNIFHQFNKKLLFWGNVEKSFPGIFDATVGLNYQVSHFIFEGGISLQKLLLNIFFSWKKFNIELESTYHYRLGYAPALHLYYLF